MGLRGIDRVNGKKSVVLESGLKAQPVIRPCGRLERERGPPPLSRRGYRPRREVLHVRSSVGPAYERANRVEVGVNRQERRVEVEVLGRNRKPQTVRVRRRIALQQRSMVVGINIIRSD